MRQRSKQILLLKILPRLSQSFSSRRLATQLWLLVSLEAWIMPGGEVKKQLQMAYLRAVILAFRGAFCTFTDGT